MDNSNSAEKLNQSQLARALKISRQAVHKLIAAGKLVPDNDGKMTLADAQAAIAATVHPGAKSAQQGGELPGDFHEARFLTEIETWQLKRIEREKRQAQLIAVDSVTRVAAAAFAHTREALLQLPARLSSPLAAENSAQQVYATLHKEISQALQQLASAPDVLERLARQQADG